VSVNDRVGDLFAPKAYTYAGEKGARSEGDRRRARRPPLGQPADPCSGLALPPGAVRRAVLAGRPGGARIHSLTPRAGLRPR